MYLSILSPQTFGLSILKLNPGHSCTVGSNIGVKTIFRKADSWENQQKFEMFITVVITIIRGYNWLLQWQKRIYFEYNAFKFEIKTKIKIFLASHVERYKKTLYVLPFFSLFLVTRTIRYTKEWLKIEFSLFDLLVVLSLKKICIYWLLSVLE